MRLPLGSRSSSEAARLAGSSVTPTAGGPAESVYTSPVDPVRIGRTRRIVAGRYEPHGEALEVAV